MKVMAHEDDLLATSSLQNQGMSVSNKRHSAYGGLRAYRCADGYVGTFEEVLAHSQKVEVRKSQGMDDSMPMWWSFGDHGASNRRKAATRMISMSDNSLPGWWSRWDHGASNRRKASARMSRTDDGLPVWWSNFGHDASGCQ